MMKWMTEAIAEAAKAEKLGEVPVGAVMVLDGEVIARAHNRMESDKDCSSHAELLAIRQASKHLSSWRLTGASLYVTLEPCPMCIGAIVLARVSQLYFGA